MDYLPEFLTVAFIDLLAIIGPGPAFTLIVRNSIKYSKKTAIYTAMGLGLGILIHVVNSLIGIGFLISKSGSFFSIIKFIGAFYLIYLGYKSLTDKLHTSKANNQQANDISNLKAILMGFITNTTNPNALVFFLSLFTLVINRSTPLSIKSLYGIEMAIAEFTWFAIIGTIISHKFIKQKIGKFQLYVEKIMGVILILLGIKIFLS